MRFTSQKCSYITLSINPLKSNLFTITFGIIRCQQSPTPSKYLLRFVLVSMCATVCLVVAGGLLVFLASQDIGCFKPLLTSELKTSKLEVLFSVHLLLQSMTLFDRAYKNVNPFEIFLFHNGEFFSSAAPSLYVPQG